MQRVRRCLTSPANPRFLSRHRLDQFPAGPWRFVRLKDKASGAERARLRGGCGCWLCGLLRNRLLGGTLDCLIRPVQAPGNEKGELLGVGAIREAGAEEGDDLLGGFVLGFNVQPANLCGECHKRKTVKWDGGFGRRLN